MIYTIRFKGGLADGKELIVSRAPKYLRICYDQMGRLRALADPNDKATKMDGIYYYVLRERKKGDPYVYEWPNRAQPCVNWMRSNSEWRSFVEGEVLRYELNNPDKCKD